MDPRRRAPGPYNKAIAAAALDLVSFPDIALLGAFTGGGGRVYRYSIII